jgi:two-component sensor histidine kinase
MTHACSGDEGLTLLAAEHFDVVALDHHMPEKTGLEVLAEIRALPSHPPVIYVTGSEDSRVAVAALKAGAIDYVWKDVQGHFRELLLEAVGNALQQEALRQAKEDADREVREARDRAELLLKEVNHRVANSLALVAGFARLQAGTVTDPAARTALDEMQVRIQAIAGVHRRLYTSDNVQAVGLAAYLGSLVEELEASMRAAGRDHALILSADGVEVPPDKAVAIGVIVTELVTNAYKYAYAEGVRGEIRVRLSRCGDTAQLVIEDDGEGYSGDAVARGTGLGMRIVKAMAGNLRSEVAFDAAHKGVRATVAFTP